MTIDGMKLLKDFRDNGISRDAKDKRFENTLAFQDFIGHMNKNELYDFYVKLEQHDRSHFIWSCSVCLSPDSLIDILKSTTILLERERIYDDFEKDIGEREDALFFKKRTFQDCKKPIHKRLARLEREKQALKERFEYQRERADRLEKSNDQFRSLNSKLTSKACDLDNLKAAFSLLNA